MVMTSGIWEGNGWQGKLYNKQLKKLNFDAAGWCSSNALFFYVKLCIFNAFKQKYNNFKGTLICIVFDLFYTGNHKLSFIMFSLN